MDVSGYMEPPSDTEGGPPFSDPPASSGETSPSTMDQDSSTFEASTNPGLGLDNGSFSDTEFVPRNEPSSPQQARAPLAGLRTESASNLMLTDPQVIAFRPSNANFDANGPVVTGSPGPPPINTPLWQGNNAAAVQLNATPFGTNPQTPVPYTLNSQPQNIPSAAGMPMNFGETGVVINIQNGHNYHVGAGAGAITGFVSQGVDMGLNTLGRGGVAGTFPPNGGPVAGTEMGMLPSTSGQGMNTPANSYSFSAVNTIASGGGSTNSNLLGNGIPSGTGDSTRHNSNNRGNKSTVARIGLAPDLQMRHAAAVSAFREAYGHDVPRGPVQLSDRNSPGSYVGRNTTARFNEAYSRMLVLSMRAAADAAAARLPNRNTPNHQVLGPGYTGRRSQNGASGPAQPVSQARATPPTTSGNALPMDMNGFPAMGTGPQIDLTGLNINDGMPTAQLAHASMPSGISVGNTGTMPQGAEQNAPEDEDNGQGDVDMAEVDTYIKESGPQEEGSL